MKDFELHLGDCLEVMDTLPRVDAVITDPPYGVGENRDKVMSRGKLAKPIDYGEFDWDNMPATPEQIEAMRSISKEQVIFGGNYFDLPPSPSWIVWDKLNGSNDFADCELAWTSHNKAVRKFTYLWNGMIKQKPEKRFHPTQKPLALMLWVVENYTAESDTILDPFMGSGTTGVACAQLKRKFIGIELAPDYFEIAEKRIKTAYSQKVMF